MENYTPSRIIKPMVEFILTYPSWEYFEIKNPHGFAPNIDIGDFASGDTVAQLALDYVGSIVISNASDILMDQIITRQANFQLLLLQSSGDNVFRTDVTDFLYDFERWIDYKQARRETPILGDEPYDERMWADNGSFFSQWEGQAASVYMIQLHKIYKNYYDMEED